MSIVEEAIDLGQVWQDEEPVTTIHLQNTSSWALASWSLKALPLPKAEPAPINMNQNNVLDLDRDESDGSSSGTDQGMTPSDSLDWLHIPCSSGTIEPNGSTRVQVIVSVCQSAS